MLTLILQSFWFFLPAGIANMTPVLVKKIPFLNSPIDQGKKFRCKPILGKNKTWRGLIFGTTAAIATVYIQAALYTSTETIAFLNYTETNLLLLGFLLGFGALLGDMVFSFLKRQRGIDSGKPWFPWDQLDWIIGSMILVHVITHLSYAIEATILILFLILHPLINYTGYILKIKENKW